MPKISVRISPFVRKLEKAVAVCGIRSGIPEEISGKVLGELLENFAPLAKCYKILGFRAPDKANLSGTLGRHCPEPCPHILFLKSTVTAFSSFAAFGFPRFPLFRLWGHFLFHLSDNSRRLWLSKIRCWKSLPANLDAAGKFFTDFPAAPNAVPAKVWAFSGKENGCWKMGLAFGNAPGSSPLKPPQPSWVSLNLGLTWSQFLEASAGFPSRILRWLCERGPQDFPLSVKVVTLCLRGLAGSKEWFGVPFIPKSLPEKRIEN